MSAPLIDTTRLQFGGLSEESFEDIPEIGELRTFTVLARCTAHNERAMANEGTRRSATMKVERVRTGVDEKIEADEPAEPNLFDTTPTAEGDEPSTLADGISEFAGDLEAAGFGPTFSGDDE